MSYELTLEKAGAKVLAFQEFGSYQGTWLAFVEYKGEKGIVEGSYGSCSGCDAYQATFDYGDEPCIHEGKYYTGYYCEENECSKEEYDKLQEACERELADFGAQYLNTGLYDKSHYENLLKRLDSDDWFDSETEEYCNWAINQNW